MLHTCERSTLVRGGRLFEGETLLHVCENIDFVLSKEIVSLKERNCHMVVRDCPFVVL